MRKLLLIGLLLTLPTAIHADDGNAQEGSDEITYCPASRYADCTQARDCKPDDSGSVLCSCPVAESDSVTTGGCQAAAEGKLQSRYPGLPAMGACTSGDGPWADCLGVVCEDADPDGQATCACRVAQSDALASEQYVIAGVKEGDAAAACRKGVYNSSATLGQVFSATMVLRSGREAAGEGQTVDPVITWIH